MAIRRSLSIIINKKRRPSSVRSLYSRSNLSEISIPERDPDEIIQSERQEDHNYDPNDGSADSTKTSRLKIREKTKAAWMAFKLKLKFAKL